MRYLVSMLAAGALSACASTTQTENRFGADTRITLARQIMHPDADKNADPVNGMDGRAARAAYDRYQRAASDTSRQGQP